jgi:hypothetical protein
MKCTKCNNILHIGTGEISINFDGKTMKVINVPILHCKNSNSVVVDDEVKE